MRIDDSNSTLTLYYTHGNNHLDLKAIYANMQTLYRDHPGRARFDLDTHKLTPCSDEFLETFWSIAASLLDYFADFYATDTALMQSIWFHILDQWQSISPLHIYRGDFEFRFSHTAERFEKDYKDTIDLLHRLITSKHRTQPFQKLPPDHTVDIIHDPTGHVEGLAGHYETGPFISGLKPWQQFLYAGAPGFQPAPPDELVAHTTDTKDGTACYIPQPALALIAAHTSRARLLSARVAQEEGWDLPETLAAFDAHALAFPSTLTASHTYPALINPGKTLTYQLVQGAPPIRRHEGLTDPSMMIENPDLVLLDEAVGSCKGRDAYVPMTGPVGSEGVGFDVWRVERGADGWLDEKEGAGVEGMGELFDEWWFDDEEGKKEGEKRGRGSVGM